LEGGTGCLRYRQRLSGETLNERHVGGERV
jgi:hypothetical protein